MGAGAATGAVEIDRCFEALGRFIDGRGRLCVPARADDDDLYLVRAIDELVRLRAEVERLRADVAALERGQLLATGRAARVVWSPTGVSVRVDE